MATLIDVQGLQGNIHDRIGRTQCADLTSAALTVAFEYLPVFSGAMASRLQSCESTQFCSGMSGDFFWATRPVIGPGSGTRQG